MSTRLGGIDNIEQATISKETVRQWGGMLGVTHYRSSKADDDKYHLKWPETGGIRIVVELLLLIHLVRIGMPVLTEQIGMMNPEITPEPFSTIVYVTLGAGVIGVIAWLFYSDSFFTTHRFKKRRAAQRRLKHDVPGRRWLARYGAAALIGGSLSWVTYERFVFTFLHVLDLLVIVVEEFRWTVTVVDGLSAVGFLGGFVLFAIGLDRLIVGGIRWMIRRQQN